VLHHQLVSDEGTLPGMVNPTAGKQLGGLETAAKSARYSGLGERAWASIEDGGGRASVPPSKPKSVAVIIQVKEIIFECQQFGTEDDWRTSSRLETTFKYHCFFEPSKDRKAGQRLNPIQSGHLMKLAG